MMLFDTSGIEAWVTVNNPKYANPSIQQMYINGHFCYAYKFGIVTKNIRLSILNLFWAPCWTQDANLFRNYLSFLNLSRIKDYINK